MIIKKTLPRYSDDEVTVFHPLFERACIEAIDDLGLSSEIKVEHHKSFGGLTVDFAIERIVTSRVVLLVEIKRTPSAVKSTRNRHQALSYRKEADSISETPYYVLTNLEITELFKYDPHRPRPSSQIISESPFYAGLMSASCFGDFYNNLIAIIKRIIDITLGDAGEYKNNSEELHQKLKACVNDKNNWHKVFMAASYEYIRGAASRHADLSKRISNNGWKPADQYLSDPSRLSSKGALIDFDKIFCGPLPEPNHPEAFDPRYLNELYNAGISSTDGEDIVEAVNNVLGPSEPGIVETDVELARLLSIISGDTLGGMLNQDDIVCDPCAGSGRLLAEALKTTYTSCNPKQLWANEIDSRFSQSLSLRVGLMFANSIEPTNAPKITINDINNLNPADFDKVKVVLMNPPYLSGIQSIANKEKFAGTIEKNFGEKSKTDNGQIGQEAVITELVSRMIKDGTVFSIILPYSILIRKSPEFCIFRKYLLDNYGLTHIVSYPRDGLFKEVVKRTFIVSGMKGYNGDVKRITSDLPLDRIDLDQLRIGLEKGSRVSTRGITVDSIARKELDNSINDGWINGARNRAKSWAAKELKKFIKLPELATTKRGSTGNSGASDLQCLKIGKDLYSSIVPLIPVKWMCCAINNADDKFVKVLDNTNKPGVSFKPPDSAFNKPTSGPGKRLDQIINSYLKFKACKKKADGKQTKKTLTLESVRNTLKRDIKIIEEASILIPRATRKEASIGVLNVPFTVSTNFIYAKFDDILDSFFVASWLFSIYGQILMEAENNDQEGMRKLEKANIDEILIPHPNKYSKRFKQDLIDIYKRTEPLDLLDISNLQARDLDIEWAKVLKGSRYKIFISSSLDLLKDLCEERNP